MWSVSSGCSLTAWGIRRLPPKCRKKGYCPHRNTVLPKRGGDTAHADKARDWHYAHVKEILTGEYYIGNMVHGKQTRCLATGRKNTHTPPEQWVRLEGVHEPLDQLIFNAFCVDESKQIFIKEDLEAANIYNII